MRRLAALLLIAAPLAAQNPALPPARADSVRADTIDTDTVRPILPTLGSPPGPLARDGRWVFDRDALRFLGALSLGELLAQVPGVFLVRGGYFGQSEFVAWAGQGASSVELYWDGFAMDPLGADSSAIDLSRISLGLVRRVEVEVLPSVLRVYLTSDTQRYRSARTETSFAAGDAQTNTYTIRYLNRWRDGSGLGLGVNFFGTDGPSTTPGSVGDLTLWAKATWTPSPFVGVEWQILSYAAKRDSLRRSGAAGGSGIPGTDGTRRDAFVRGHFATREDGLGLRFDAILGSTSYTDSLGNDRSLSQASGAASYRAAGWSGEYVVRLRDARTPLEMQLRMAWTRQAWLTVSGYAMRRSHEGARHSTEFGGGADLRVSRFVLHGAARWRDAVLRPDLMADTAQTAGDWSAGLSAFTRPLTLDVTVSRHAAVEAPVWDVLRLQVPAAPVIDVTTVTASFSLRPLRSWTLSGWYRHPLDPILAAYEPAHHSRVALTFRSRMLPRYRRGVFDLLIQSSMEGWGDGIAGRDGSGNDIRMLGATTVNYLLEIRLIEAVLFWTLRNANAERYQIVPGFDQGRALQRFGVRWEFAN